MLVVAAAITGWMLNKEAAGAAGTLADESDGAEGSGAVFPKEKAPEPKARADAGAGGAGLTPGCARLKEYSAGAAALDIAAG